MLVKLASSYTDKIWLQNCLRVTVAKLFCQCKWGDMNFYTPLFNVENVAKFWLGHHFWAKKLASKL